MDCFVTSFLAMTIRWIHRNDYCADAIGLKGARPAEYVRAENTIRLSDNRPTRLSALFLLTLSVDIMVGTLL
jgi:hypothetical protein